MAPGSRNDPYPGFRFYVQIDSLVVAGFSDVSGLEMEVETESYGEGGRNDYTHEFPGRATYPNLELRRGLTDSTTLVDWMRAVVDGRIERRNVHVFLHDAEGQPRWGWQCREAYPVRYAGPDLQADQSTVAMEALELSHNGLSRMDVR